MSLESDISTLLVSVLGVPVQVNSGDTETTQKNNDGAYATFQVIYSDPEYTGGGDDLWMARIQVNLIGRNFARASEMDALLTSLNRRRTHLVGVDDLLAWCKGWVEDDRRTGLVGRAGEHEIQVDVYVWYERRVK